MEFQMISTLFFIPFFFVIFSGDIVYPPEVIASKRPLLHPPPPFLLSTSALPLTWDCGFLGNEGTGAAFSLGREEDAGQVVQMVSALQRNLTAPSLWCRELRFSTMLATTKPALPLS